LIEVAIYLLIGTAISLYASMQNSKYEKANTNAEKISVRKSAFALIVFVWPIYIMLWLSLIFTQRKDLSDE
jgi:hypothetical protein